MPLRFDIQVQVPSTLRIENNLARLVASADLQLRGTYDRPLLFGRAEVDRGEVTFEGRRYLVTKGAIDFTNPTRIEPFFDVEAETRVRVPGQTYRVIVRAAGTMERLQPTLESDPPLPAADVLALLFSDVRRDQGPGNAELRALQNPNERPTGHPDDARDAAARQPDLVGGRTCRRADVRRRHLPADAVAVRSLQPVARRRASIRRRASRSASACRSAST